MEPRHEKTYLPLFRTGADPRLAYPRRLHSNKIVLFLKLTFLVSKNPSMSFEVPVRRVRVECCRTPQTSFLAFELKHGTTDMSADRGKLSCFSCKMITFLSAHSLILAAIEIYGLLSCLFSSFRVCCFDKINVILIVIKSPWTPEAQNIANLYMYDTHIQ